MKLCYTISIIILSFVTGCLNNKSEKILKINLDLKIERFEKDLFSIDPGRIEENIEQLKTDYGLFFQYFSESIIRIGQPADSGYSNRLKRFITDYDNFKLYEKTLEIYDNFKEESKEIINAFKLYKYYFPENNVPRVITFISYFNEQMFAKNDILAIGLDMYLGKDEPLYGQLGIYSYIKEKMHKKMIVSDCMWLWGKKVFAFNDSINDLISNMIYQGKIMYFVDKVLPNYPDTLKWGFSQKQLNFCKVNESSMWRYLYEHKLLYSKDKFTIQKFIQDGPFTKDFENDSPARAAVWLGYKIVVAYLNKNKNVKFKELMYDDDYVNILHNSGYKP